MPSSSIRLTKEASVKRGGGWVKCWSACVLATSAPAALAHLGQAAAFIIVLIIGLPS